MSDFGMEKVLVKQCLVDKPEYSHAHFYWILEGASYNPEKQEPLGHIGLVGARFYDNGIYAVFFVEHSSPPWGRQTAVFAHENALELTDAPYTWPEGVNEAV